MNPMSFLAFLVFALFIAADSYNWKDKLDTTTVFGVPVTFYPGLSESVQVGEIDCFEIFQCANGMGGYSQAQLVIDLPNNPGWILDKGYVLVEISKCADSYNDSCVIFTNYVWNDGLNTIAYNNITFPWNSNTNGGMPLYVRFTSGNAPADYTFQLTYGQYNYIVSGTYDPDAFPTPSSCDQNNPVKQYARPSTIVSVENFETSYYLVQFCANNNFPNTNWSANINIASTTDKPKSAFEVFACSADVTVNNCVLTHNNGRNLAATSVVTMTISDSQTVNLDNGILIGVYGIGGESDGNNQGSLTITVANT
jgi:hypothetical protein